MVNKLAPQLSMTGTNLASTSKRPLRVLYYIAYPQRMAGANRSLFNLVTNLPETISPVVLLSGEGAATDAYRAAGVELYVMPPGPNLRQYGKAVFKWSLARRAWVAIREYLPYSIKLRQMINQLKVDIVHINSPRGGLLMGPTARLAGRPVVSHMRGEASFGGITWWAFEHTSTRIVTVASAIQASLSPAAMEKSVSVYNGIQDVSQMGQPLPKYEKLRAEGQLIVCCFASIVPFKGVHHLLEATAELNQRGWRNRFLVVCIGDFVPEHRAYQDWLRQKQTELGVDNLMFTGWQSDPFSYYHSADISVLPSVSHEQLAFNGQLLDVRGGEGFPRTHLEAMCFQLPIVGTDIAGVREQIENGVNGFIVPPSDKTALATALEKLLKDPALRQQLGQNGRQRVMQKFSTEAYVAGSMDVYASVLSGR